MVGVRKRWEGDATRLWSAPGSLHNQEYTVNVNKTSMWENLQTHSWQHAHAQTNPPSIFSSGLGFDPFLYLSPSPSPSPHHVEPVFERQGLECAALVGGALQEVAAVSQQRALNVRRHLWLSAIHYMLRRLVAHWLLGRVENVPLNPSWFICFLSFNRGFSCFFCLFFYLPCSVCDP